MPIRPENRDRYPPDWPQISARIRAREGDRCKWCKVPNRVLISRGERGDAGTHMRLDTGEVCDAETGEVRGLAMRSEYDGGKYVKVVLTVAHLDHTPENCADENLAALCQRCHNRFDAPMRRAGIKARAHAACAVGDLF